MKNFFEDYFVIHGSHCLCGRIAYIDFFILKIRAYLVLETWFLLTICLVKCLINSLYSYFSTHPTSIYHPNISCAQCPCLPKVCPHLPSLPAPKSQYLARVLTADTEHTMEHWFSSLGPEEEARKRAEVLNTTQ